MKEKDDSIAWVRVPIEHAAKIAQEAGKGCSQFRDICASGGTCIASPNFDKDASIVIEAKRGESFEELLKRTGRSTGLECYGGSTCIC